MRETTHDDDPRGMDYGDYVERLNVTLRPMVALQEEGGVIDTFEQVAERFDEHMIATMLSRLQKVQTVLVLAEAGIRT